MKKLIIISMISISLLSMVGCANDSANTEMYKHVYNYPYYEGECGMEVERYLINKKKLDLGCSVEKDTGGYDEYSVIIYSNKYDSKFEKVKMINVPRDFVEKYLKDELKGK